MATISKTGIAPQQQIKSEHLLRIIEALSGESPNIDIIVSNNISASYFIGDGSQLTNLPISGSTPDLNQVLLAGNSSSTNIIIGIDTFNGLEIGSNQIIMNYSGSNLSQQMILGPFDIVLGNGSSSYTSSISLSNNDTTNPKIIIGSNLGSSTIQQHPSQSGDKIYNLPSSSGTLSIDTHKIYTALLTQSGTSSPTASILENTIGNIVWTRGSEGYYVGTLTSAFVTDKTFVILGNTNDGDGSSSGFRSKISNNSTDNVEIVINEYNTANYIDGALLNTPVEIRVYN